jgi:hypothetical protein
VPRHCRHHRDCRRVQCPRHPQHLDVSAQDEDRQLPAHQEPLHRRPGLLAPLLFNQNINKYFWSPSLYFPHNDIHKQ